MIFIFNWSECVCARKRGCVHVCAVVCCCSALIFMVKLAICFYWMAWNWNQINKINLPLTLMDLFLLSKTPIEPFLLWANKQNFTGSCTFWKSVLLFVAACVDFCCFFHNLTYVASDAQEYWKFKCCCISLQDRQCRWGTRICLLSIRWDHSIRNTNSICLQSILWVFKFGSCGSMLLGQNYKYCHKYFSDLWYIFWFRDRFYF